MANLKICGIQPGDDLSFTEDKAVRFVGIVFAPKSRRYVNPAAAKSITSAVRGRCQCMGVFVDTPVDEVVKIAAEAGLDGVQLHGSETAEDCRTARETGLTVWKAMAATGYHDLDSLRHMLYRYSGVTDGILLDAPPPQGHSRSGVTGGFGIHFDWSLLRDLFNDMSRDESESLPPVWIAGGITPENVGELYEHWHPFGVDVSSGVEENGRKSINRILDLIEAVKQLD